MRSNLSVSGAAAAAPAILAAPLFVDGPKRARRGRYAWPSAAAGRLGEWPAEVAVGNPRMTRTMDLENGFG